jgi:hypothetical protein
MGHYEKCLQGIDILAGTLTADTEYECPKP